MYKNPEGIFKGTSSSATDLLPCPFCYSLRSRYVGNVDYYTRRYQCQEKNCGGFFRYDKRPIQDNIYDFRESEGLNFNIPNVASGK